MLSRKQGWDSRQPDSGWGQKSNLGLGTGLDGVPTCPMGCCHPSCVSLACDLRQIPARLFVPEREQVRASPLGSGRTRAKRVFC